MDQQWDTSGDGGRAIAEYDYEVVDSADEVPLRKGEVVTDIMKMSPEWWCVTNEAGKKGLVPSSYLREFPGSPPFYRYRQLQGPNDQPVIRLLEIVPATSVYNGSFFAGRCSNEPQTLRCRLIHVPLQHHMPDYDGLSYFWGNDKDLVPIQCSDEYHTGTVQITRSLRDALITFRDRPGGYRRRIWADGICMNQTKEEKNLQVPMMKQIYQRAATVIVWLGDEANETQPALQAITKCARACFTHKDASVIGWVNWNWMLLGFRDAREARYQIRALCKLLARPYWRRFWIIQEFTVSKSLSFACGPFQISEADLVNASGWLITSSAAMLFAPWNGNNLVGLHAVRSELSCGIHRPLLILLDGARGSHSGDPRDKIWAIYSLASDCGSGKNTVNVEPDYAKPTEQVYKELAISFLRSKQNLDIITVAGRFQPREPPASMMPPGFHVKRCKGLPSWVPDWSSPDGTLSIPVWSSQKVAAGPGATGQPFYIFPEMRSSTEFHACGNTSYTFQEPTESDGLRVWGQEIDTIAGLSQNRNMGIPVPTQDQWHIEQSDKEETARAIENLEQICNWTDLIGADSNRIYFTGEPMIEVFWQTMLCGHFPNGFQAERKTFYDWYVPLKPTFDIQRQVKTFPWLRNKMVKGYAIALQLQGQLPKQSFVGKTDALVANKDMFVTKSGYVGLVARGAKVGDSVVILEGGCIPFIVRPQSHRGIQHWELIAGCYLHGGMQGHLFRPGYSIAMVIV